MTNEELAIQIKQGINVEVNKAILYEQMKRYIYKIAQDYKWYADFEDILQEGYIGLEKAIGGFDETKGKFVTYAGDWIAQAMQRYIYNTCTTSRIPVHAWEKIKRYDRAVTELECNNAEATTLKQIAEKMNVSTKEVERIRQNAEKRYQGSLNEQYGEEGELERIDLVPSKENVEDSVVERVYQEELKTTLWGCVDELPNKQATVLHKHYQDNLCYEDIGVLLGISKDEAYRLRMKAIKKLKCGNFLTKLKPFIDDIRSCAVQCTGAGYYKRTGTSSTERTVLMREKYRELQTDILVEMARMDEEDRLLMEKIRTRNVLGEMQA